MCSCFIESLTFGSTALRQVDERSSVVASISFLPRPCMCAAAARRLSESTSSMSRCSFESQLAPIGLCVPGRCLLPILCLVSLLAVSLPPGLPWMVPLPAARPLGPLALLDWRLGGFERTEVGGSLLSASCKGRAAQPLLSATPSPHERSGPHVGGRGHAGSPSRLAVLTALSAASAKSGAACVGFMCRWQRSCARIGISAQTSSSSFGRECAPSSVFRCVERTLFDRSWRPEAGGRIGRTASNVRGSGTMCNTHLPVPLIFLGIGDSSSPLVLLTCLLSRCSGIPPPVIEWWARSPSQLSGRGGRDLRRPVLLLEIIDAPPRRPLPSIRRATGTTIGRRQVPQIRCPRRHQC